MKKILVPEIRHQACEDKYLEKVGKVFLLEAQKVEGAGGRSKSLGV